MSNYRSRLFITLFAALAALLGVAPATAATQSAAPASFPSSQSSLFADCGDTSGFQSTSLSALPPEAGETYELIQDGGPYPYPQDGTVFQNRERLLPLCSSGYYHEYTVETPGSDDRGARRIVTGEGGEYFYTADHYESFVLIDADAYFVS
jgi:ribonuclease T1